MNFQNIIGQQSVVKFLQTAYQQNRIAGLYIFHGLPSVGKTTTAVNFAAAVNCKNHPGQGCDSCLICRKFLQLNHPDLIIITPADSSDPKQIEQMQTQIIEEGNWRINESPQSMIRISQIRDLQEKIKFHLWSATRRFVVVVNAEKMRVETANAFLKTLEEPPLDTTIILVTSQLGSLLPTIISRAQLVKFNALKINQITQILHQQYSLSETQAQHAAKLGNGQLQKSLKFAIDEDLVNFRLKIIDSFLTRSIAEFIKICPVRINQRDQMVILLELLNLINQDCLYLKQGWEKKIVNYDFKEKLLDYARGVNISKLVENNKILEQAYQALNLFIDPVLIRDHLIGEIYEC
jgi:DNA polymerase III subunit delta'